MYQMIEANGYRQVTLKIQGKDKKYYVHRIIASKWCDGYSAGLVVNHIDGNKLNNAASNLELITQAANVSHAAGYADYRTRGASKRAIYQREWRAKRKSNTLDINN